MVAGFHPSQRLRFCRLYSHCASAHGVGGSKYQERPCFRSTTSPSSLVLVKPKSRLQTIFFFMCSRVMDLVDAVEGGTKILCSITYVLQRPMFDRRFSASCCVRRPHCRLCCDNLTAELVNEIELLLVLMCNVAPFLELHDPPDRPQNLDF